MKKLFVYCMLFLTACSSGSSSELELSIADSFESVAPVWISAGQEGSHQSQVYAYTVIMYNYSQYDYDIANFVAIVDEIISFTDVANMDYQTVYIYIEDAYGVQARENAFGGLGHLNHYSEETGADRKAITYNVCESDPLGYGLCVALATTWAGDGYVYETAGSQFPPLAGLSVEQMLTLPYTNEATHVASHLTGLAFRDLVGGKEVENMYSNQFSREIHALGIELARVP